MTMQFVIAGNYHEYIGFLERQSLPRGTNRYIFISDPMRLHGKYGMTVVCVGNYWKSPVFTHQERQEGRDKRNIFFISEDGKELR